ncbi:MAG: serine protease [Solirubrobacterales bacterium]|jgi:subtilisin family serine protease|nr:serine protease [Solirubrobacterales bacterium]
MRISTATATVVFACALAIGAASTEAASRAPAAVDSPHPTGRLLAELDTPGPLAGRGADSSAVRSDRAGDARALIARLGERYDVEQGVPLAALAAVRPAPGESVDQLRSALIADPAVKRVDTEYYRELRGYIPNDPAYSAFDSLNAPFPPNGDRFQWNLRKANFETAWAISHGAGAKVAIVDTGVSATSPDLSQVAAAVDQDPLDILNGPQTDQNGHGTHVAGLACGNSDNGYGVASAGFDCPLIVEKLKVSGNSLDEASVVAGITDAAARGAAVINLSLGGCGPDNALKTALDQAWAAGSIPVVAATNPGDSCGGAQAQGYPAGYVQPAGTAPDQYFGKGLVVTMAKYDGTNANDPVAGLAGHGTGVSVAAYGDSSALPAPGHPNGLPGIFSTWPANTTSREGTCPASPCPRTSFGGDNRFGYLFGTSMATPQVSGLVALIRSANPGMAPSQVIRTIKLTASNGGKWGDPLGWGVIDAGTAVGVATGRDFSPPTSSVKSKKRTRTPAIKLRIDASDADPFGNTPSGIDSVSVFVAKGHGDYALLDKTSKRSITFKGKRGVKYRFYSLAVDKAGNREAAPARPDSTTLVKRPARRR